MSSNLKPLRTKPAYLDHVSQVDFQESLELPQRLNGSSLWSESTEKKELMTLAHVMKGHRSDSSFRLDGTKVLTITGGIP